MKILANVEGLGIRATIHTTDLAKDTLVAISGDETVDAAGSGDIVIGHISVPSPTGADKEGTVEVHGFTRLFTAKAVGGALAAGAQVKAGAPASGVSTVADLASGDRKLLVGIVWIGAAENGTVTVLGR